MSFCSFALVKNTFLLQRVHILCFAGQFQCSTTNKAQDLVAVQKLKQYQPKTRPTVELADYVSSTFFSPVELSQLLILMTLLCLTTGTPNNH